MWRHVRPPWQERLTSMNKDDIVRALEAPLAVDVAISHGTVARPIRSPLGGVVRGHIESREPLTFSLQFIPERALILPKVVDATRLLKATLQVRMDEGEKGTVMSTRVDIGAAGLGFFVLLLIGIASVSIGLGYLVSMGVRPPS